MAEERHLKALRLLEQNPEMTQRELAEALGVSVGAANYCLKALVEKGWVKLENFQKNPNKLGYLYLLTPMGIAAKAQLTASFLRRKMAEYEALRSEIDQLQAEIDGLAMSERQTIGASEAAIPTLLKKIVCRCARVGHG